MPPRTKEPSAARIDFTCPQCGATVPVQRAGQVTACPACNQKLSKVAQLDQLLSRWWEPRRWRADLVKPSVPYLIERLWTANGQGERLYVGVSPRYTNYDIFRNMVTRLMIRGRKTRSTCSRSSTRSDLLRGWRSCSPRWTGTSPCR